MEVFKDNLHWSFEAKIRLRVVIVGAGIAGLTSALGLQRAGHDVVLLERVSRITEVGAGILIAPNASRILGRLGLLDKILEKSNLLERISVRRYQNDEELGAPPVMPQVGEKYGAPMFVIHRGDLQRILLEEVKKNDIDLRLNSRVVAVDTEFEARVQLESGQWVKGDVIIAADGIKSDIRRLMAEHHGIKDRSRPTGDAAYRILIHEEKLRGNERALELLRKNEGMRWMGPGGHIMAYPIKNNKVYNMVLMHPEKPGAENEESWTRKGNKDEMMTLFSGWNELVRDLLSYVPEGEILEWTLNSHYPLPTWIENKCVLMGDACHPMLPYSAQGAAQAIEDAGELICALSLAVDIGTALGVYETVRKARAEKIQNDAEIAREILHLPDGEKQLKRDSAIRGGKNPDLWADYDYQQFMWGTDVMKYTVDNWEKLEAQVQGHYLGSIKDGVC